MINIDVGQRWVRKSDGEIIEIIELLDRKSSRSLRVRWESITYPSPRKKGQTDIYVNSHFDLQRPILDLTKIYR